MKTPREAMDRLKACIQDILDSGFIVKGIDPAKVIIEKEKPRLCSVPEPESTVYTGDICSNCDSSKVIRNGSCALCLDCGTTTGCS